MNMSMWITRSSFWISSRNFSESGSLISGFSPRMSRVRSFPALIACGASVAQSPISPGSFTPQISSMTERVSGSVTKPPPGYLSGSARHVAGALDVVLPAQGADAGARAADLATDHREIGQRNDVADAVAELHHVHRPEDRRGFRAAYILAAWTI